MGWIVLIKICISFGTNCMSMYGYYGNSVLYFSFINTEQNWQSIVDYVRKICNFYDSVTHSNFNFNVFTSMYSMCGVH